jgi:hypothetical protein
VAEVAEAPRALDPRLTALKRIAIVPALNEHEAITPPMADRVALRSAAVWTG